MLNIIEPNSSPEKLPDCHPLTLLCKILNVNLLEPYCRAEASCFLPNTRVNRAELGTVPIHHHAPMSNASIDAIASKRSQ